jgi:hypothetical protein
MVKAPAPLMEAYTAMNKNRLNNADKRDLAGRR